VTLEERMPAQRPSGDGTERDETPAERMDRNWAELLQELRVVETGVQILTGFLLTLPFQQRFSQLTTDQHRLYLVVVTCSVAATGLLIAPVSYHRVLFRRHEKDRLVGAADALAKAGLVFLAVAICGVTLLVFDIVAGATLAIAVTVAAGVFFLTLWLFLPLGLRRRRGDPGR
jgi:O-antigen/teichoic acid export membrane protein